MVQKWAGVAVRNTPNKWGCMRQGWTPCLFFPLLMEHKPPSSGLLSRVDEMLPTLLPPLPLIHQQSRPQCCTHTHTPVSDRIHNHIHPPFLVAWSRRLPLRSSRSSCSPLPIIRLSTRGVLFSVQSEMFRDRLASLASVKVNDHLVMGGQPLRRASPLSILSLRYRLSLLASTPSNHPTSCSYFTHTQRHTLSHTQHTKNTIVPLVKDTTPPSSRCTSTNQGANQSPPTLSSGCQGDFQCWPSPTSGRSGPAAVVKATLSSCFLGRRAFNALAWARPNCLRSREVVGT